MSRYKETNKVAVLGMGSNFLLLVLKLVVGFLTKSQGMIADGFNSAGDVFASIMTYIGNKIASQPHDREHPYGHGKAEYIFSMIISFSLLLITFQILKSSISSIIQGEGFLFSKWLVGVSVITIILKTSLWLYTREAGKRWDNLLIIANSEDHRNDIMITSSTLLGVILGNRGLYWVDGIVGIGISIWIGYTGIQIFINAYNVLMDTNIDQTFVLDLVKAIDLVEGVDHVDNVIAKPIGVSFIIIAKVSVRGDMTVEEGHSVAARIKEKVKKHKNVGDVVVHINPA